MSKEMVLPDYLKSMLESGEAKSDASSMITAGSSMPRISLKGQKFKLIVDGETVDTIHEKIAVIILGVQPEKNMAKTFYLKGYAPDDTAPPDCSSLDGVTPDSWVANPQARNCAQCEQNKWGSAKSMSGGKAKACRDSKRLIVRYAKTPNGPDYVLNVTVSSLKALSEYGKSLAKANMPMAAAITMVVMDPDSDFSMISFSYAGALKEEMGKAMLKLSKERPWDSEPAGPLLGHDEGGPVKGLEQSKPEEKKVEKVVEKKAEKVVEKEVVKTEAKAETAVSDVDDLLGEWTQEE